MDVKLKLAPKDKQPIGGYLHPKHLLAYGPEIQAYSAGRGYYMTNEYCVSPSSSLWDAKYVR